MDRVRSAVVGGALAALVAAAGTAAAATGAVGSNALAAGAAAVGRCHTGTVAVTAAPSGGSVDSVAVDSVPATCQGGRLRVVLVDAAAGQLSEGTGTVPATGPMVVPVSPPTKWSSVAAAHVVVEGS